MAKILVNGKSYDSEDVTALINGVPIDLSEISYSSKKETQLNYALGSDKPVSYSRGKKEYEGSMSILMNNAVILESSAGGDLLTLKPFNINVSYINSSNKVVVDKIVAVFNSQGRESNGDMGLQYSYELGVLDIGYNIV